MAVTFDPNGATKAQVGPKFDIALGYLDRDTGKVKMVGYVIPPSGQSEEKTDTTDDDHLTQIASPNSTDRVARFPQVTQGSSILGERQRTFVDPSMYYYTDGNMDVSTPGRLSLLPSYRRDQYVLDGDYNLCPLVTAGTLSFVGISTGADNFAVLSGGAPALSTRANGHEIFDMIFAPFSLLVLTDEGIWGEAAGGGEVQYVPDALTLPWFPVASMAYLQTQEADVYYIDNIALPTGGSTIKGWKYPTPGVGTVLLTAPKSENWFTSICASAGSIFFTRSNFLPYQSFFYIWSGSSADLPERIAEIPGRVEAVHETQGTVYVLCRNPQPNANVNPAWTLYAVVGSQVSVIDDARYIDPIFAPNCSSVDTYDGATAPTEPDFRGSLWGDGRYLYIGWPGMHPRRIDLINTGISAVGPNETAGANSVHAHRFATSAQFPFVDVVSYGTTGVISQASGDPTTGEWVSSWYDFASPQMGKVFRTVEFDLDEALVDDQNAQWWYRTDPASSFTELDVVQTGPRHYTAIFPARTKGTEVQIRLVLTADATAGSPVVTNSTVTADMGRVIQITLSCRREQQARNQSGKIDSGPLTGSELQANILNMRWLAGDRGLCYWPDPTQAGGVDSFRVRLLDYSRATAPGEATGPRPVNGTVTQECDVVVTLVEDFDPEFGA